MIFGDSIEKVLRILYPQGEPHGQTADGSIMYWRGRILDVIYRAVALLGAIAYVPSVYLSVVEKIWWLAAFNTLGYAWFVWAAIVRRVSFILRACMLLAFIYFLGVALLVRLGPFAAGSIWLFAFPIMTSLLFGLKPAMVSLAINAATVICFGITLLTGHISIAFTPPNMADKWWVISANFLLLDTVATLSIAVLLRGLKTALEKQLETGRFLEEKHLELQKANEDLKREFAERRRAEEEIKHSHEILVTVLDSIDADVFVADIESHDILLMNRHMRESFGGDLTGAKCWEAFQDRKTPCDPCVSDSIVDADGQATGLHVWEGNNPITGRRYLNFDRAIRWIDGRLVRLQIAMDITELTRIQEEKLQLETQLRQALKMEAIGTLAGGIAHDFNNILAAILGYSEIALEDCRGQAPVDGYLNEILKAAHRAKDLTQQILTFSRQAEIAPKPVRFSSVVREAVKLLRASLPATIAIREALYSDATVMADPTQLHQVVMNLATNAAHAMEESGGILTITLEDRQGYAGTGLAEGMDETRRSVQLTVADTGQGIEPDLIDRIFDPYFTTKSKGKGTGMGLSVVHGIVKNCGGDIRVESEPGRGAVFRVFLPAHHIASQFPAASEMKMATAGQQGTILVVDDEPQVAHVLQLMLDSLGYRVTAYTSSREALQAFADTPRTFDLVITDMTMPEMTGDEFARTLLRIRPDIPIILCTGFNEQMNEERARQIGVRRLIYKPVVRNALAEIIKDLLDREG
jgi:signal transduction histidine kinase/CheY-like chemotaxis protein